MAQRTQKRKVFLFLHYYDPHDDYEAPEPFATKYADNSYAGEIAYTDYCIGQVIDKIKEVDLYDSSLIIITGDHGEMLGEHGELTHTYFVYKSAVKVPLIFKLPRQTKSRRVPHCAGIVDILPTICGILGIDIPDRIQGRDLSPYFKGKPSLDKNRSLYSESIVPTRYGANALMALTTDRYKYIQSTRPELYDIVQDPNEQNNLFEQQPERGAAFEHRLQLVLEQTLAKDTAGNQVGLTAQDLYRLESLGYVGGTNDQRKFDPNQDDAKDLIDFHVSFKQALMFEHKRQYAQSKQILRKLSLERPTFPETFLKLARIAFQEQKFEEALESFYASIKLSPNNSDARQFRLIQKIHRLIVLSHLCCKNRTNRTRHLFTIIKPLSWAFKRLRSIMILQDCGQQKGILIRHSVTIPKVCKSILAIQKFIILLPLFFFAKVNGMTLLNTMNNRSKLSLTRLPR